MVFIYTNFSFFNCCIHCMYENLIICQTMFMCWLKYFCCCSKAGEFFHHIYKKYILRKVQAIIWILFHIYLLLTVGPLITLTPLSIYKSKVPHWSSQHLTWLLNNNRCIYSYNVAVRKTWKCFSQKLLQKLVLKLPKSILKRNTLQLTCIFKKNDFCINSGNRVNTVCSSVLVTRAIDFCCYATYGILQFYRFIALTFFFLNY